MKKLISLGIVLLMVRGALAQPAEKSLIDYFLPMPVRGTVATNV